MPPHIQFDRVVHLIHFMLVNMHVNTHVNAHVNTRVKTHLCKQVRGFLLRRESADGFRVSFNPSGVCADILACVLTRVFDMCVDMCV